jgi:hypothetical protein
MRQHTLLRGLVAGTAVLAAACSDSTQPTPQAAPSADLGAVGGLQSDDPVALARQVPGFGGFFYDEAGVPTIYLKEVGHRTGAERALQPFLAAQGMAASALQVRKADFDWASLERWQTAASTEALSLRGTVYVDADESRNRVKIGVERGTPAGQVKAALARMGVPASAAVIEEVEPITNAATLRDRIRPVQGGLQINFPGFLCTLGFNARRGTQRSFITNSHCTEEQGGNQSTPYWQPSQTSAPTRIATEVHDPGYTQGNGCPAGRRCRRSDAARALCQRHHLDARRDREDHRSQQRVADDLRPVQDHRGRQPGGRPDREQSRTDHGLESRPDHQHLRQRQRVGHQHHPALPVDRDRRRGRR